MSETRTTELLQQTSRTFALAIPLLPEPCRRAVTQAYLLFRIADTLEDAASWSVGHRVEALGELSELLLKPDLERARVLAQRWAAARPSEQAGYMALLAELPELLGAIGSLEPRLGQVICTHGRRTATGMAEIQVQYGRDGQLRLQTLEDLRRYCYVVAGIVGELLTELFLIQAPSLTAVATELRKEQVAFGEALQLVNILKDEAVDRQEGRALLPGSVARLEVLALAREDLGRARRYIQHLRTGQAPAGVVGFTQLPLELAEASLTEVERHGPGAKVSRSRVLEMLARAREMIGPAAP